MIAKGIDKLEELIKSALTSFKSESGFEYVHTTPTMLKDPEPNALGLCSLSSLIDFHKTMKNEEKVLRFFCVISPTQIAVLPKRRDKWNRRAVLSGVDLTSKMPSFQYGKRYNQEDFIIQLNQCFFGDSWLKEIIDLVSSIKVTDESGIEDNGISQTVHVKGGTVLKEKADIKNPVKLLPYLTFPEIGTVEQEFILRVYRSRGDTELALHASESNLWELNVMESIKKYLKEKLPEMLVV